MAKALTMLALALSWTVVLAAQQKPDDIPDAPSATRPIPPPPQPSPRQEAQGDTENSDSSSTSSDKTGAGVTSGSSELPRSDSSSSKATSGSNAPGSAPDMVYDKSTTTPPPMPPVKTVPAGSVPRDEITGEDTGFVIRKSVSLVMVPVTVLDADGRMTNGLRPENFSILENGQPQVLKFFTSDPFALSAAVIIDTGIVDSGLKKVQATLSALQGAFSQFDEVAVYTYSTRVGRVTDFTSVGKELTAVMNEIKGFSGESNGPPVTSGPLGPQGPIINGRPVDFPVDPVSTPPKVARVLNDAILQAARDLSKRPRERRKIIFIISDGREQGSIASYKDTLKVLLTQEITVYAVGVEGAAIPVYDRLQRIHLPKSRWALGYSDILPKYVSATGGGRVPGAFEPGDMERIYAKAMGEARNQYTLGYSPKARIGGYREIEVRVRGRGNDLKVYAKAGYYPLPSALPPATTQK